MINLIDLPPSLNSLGLSCLFFLSILFPWIFALEELEEEDEVELELVEIGEEDELGDL